MKGTDEHHVSPSSGQDEKQSGLDEKQVLENIDNTLKDTDFPIGKQYKGKVRDNYLLGDRRLIVATDRLSAFDRIITALPFKGQMLSQMSNYWFGRTRHIIRNHLLDIPDPNVVVVHECKPLPVEMVVRGYLTGSLWRAYAEGQRFLYGMKFNADLRKDQAFDHPLITPTTKAAYGTHDTPISREKIISEGLVEKNVYEQMEEVSLKLFSFATRELEKNGLLLVDTKYEFGIHEGQLMLMDEIHTSDSSRFWEEEFYERRFEAGQDQEALDKEYVRQWLLSQGFKGDGEPPTLPTEVIVKAVLKYHTALERITGEPLAVRQGDVLERITTNLKNKGYLP
ncbi:MAG: phosphoribosylaminoimidazolesuccinocarboxamide synthase [DPANN group archaeon]|nr:phosphoribosylaminoimidazolesuccinocarboxamide synthase [DPANN group archaeon]